MPRYHIHQGDSLEVLQALDAGSFDAIITDPPYSSGGAFRGDRMQSTRSKYVQTQSKHQLADFTGDNLDQRAYLLWSMLWMTRARALAKPGAILGVFTDWRQLPTMTDALQCAGWVWRGVGVWAKKSGRPVLGRYASQTEFFVWGTNGPRPTVGPCGRGVWHAPTPSGKQRVHITQKPVEVMRGVLAPLRNKGAVLDPFAGSGSTGVACMLEGIDFVGIELDPDNIKITRRRCDDAIAQHAAGLPELQDVA